MNRLHTCLGLAAFILFTASVLVSCPTDGPKEKWRERQYRDLTAMDMIMITETSKYDGLYRHVRHHARAFSVPAIRI